MRTICAALAFALALAAGCSGELVPMGPGDGDGPDGSAPVEVPAFRPDIQTDLNTMGCVIATCHGSGSDVPPMQLTASPLTDAEWEENYSQVMERTGTLAASLLIDKATGAGTHPATLDVGDPMLDRWRGWIDQGAPYQATASAPDAGATGPDGGPPANIDAGTIALTWDDDIGPLMATAGCAAPCHGTSGAYSLESYSAALGFGADGSVANVIPGNALSLLAVYCEQGHYDMPFADTLIVLSWIVDFDARER